MILPPETDRAIFEAAKGRKRIACGRCGLELRAGAPPTIYTFCSPCVIILDGVLARQVDATPARRVE